jgi:soluble lytic murein transglycosylase-like protein
MLAMPVFAASDVPLRAPSVTTVVRADEKTGHLVRSVVVKPAAATAEPSDPALKDPSEMIEMINRIAAEQGVEESLVHSVIRAESNYNPHAVSPKGALGIMQLIPSTAKRFGVSDAFDVRDNVLGGVKYLRFLLDYYQNDYVRAIAAYNAGEAAVDKYNGIPPYGETRNYVYQVAQNLRTARARRSAAAKNAESAPADKQETYKRIETSVGSDGRIYYRTP